MEDEEKWAAQEAAFLKLYQAITAPEASPLPAAASIAGALENGEKDLLEDSAAVGVSPSSMLPGGLFARAMSSKRGGGSGGVAVAASVVATSTAPIIPVATVKERQHIEGEREARELRCE